MTWRSTDRSTTLRVISAAILIAGLLGAMVIYWNAAPPPELPLGADLEESKQYLRQLELYGGKANVLGEELREWFDGLWHGRSLAFTVGFLALLVAAGFRVAAIPLPPLEAVDTAGDAGAGSSGTGSQPGATPT